MIREGAWKYVRKGKQEFLYGLKEDPYELSNLIKIRNRPAISGLLRTKLEEWLKRTPAVANAVKKQEQKAPKRKAVEKDKPQPEQE